MLWFIQQHILLSSNQVIFGLYFSAEATNYDKQAPKGNTVPSACSGPVYWDNWEGGRVTF